MKTAYVGTERARTRDLQAALGAAQQHLDSAVAEFDALAASKAELTAMLAAATTCRQSLERGLETAESALVEANSQAVRALMAAGQQAAEREAALDEQIKQASAAREALEEELADRKARFQQEHLAAVADITRLRECVEEFERQLSETSATRDTLQQTLAANAVTLREAQQRHDEELKSAADELAERRARIDQERAQAETERVDLTAKLQEMNNAHNRARGEHQSALAEIARITEDAAAERASAASRQAELEARIEQLATERQEMECRFAEARSEFQRELQQSRTENRRMFQQAPVPMFRCTKDGELIQANRLLPALVGRRSADEFRGAELAALFESPNDLSWLIERCLSSKGKESFETTWHRKDGGRLWVRLSACAISSSDIECGVEDLTPYRALNDRLSQAHRMEAVGRLAAEVAVTCGSLLEGVEQNEEISRAAGLLRQLAAYGEEESRTPAVAELGAVVRDLAPVLKRLAGDAVDVQLSAARTPVNVDAGPERVKRLLVNLAGYGRERMPFGGKLKIEFGTTVVDRHFAAKHPNVRLGPHALLTVTESRRASRQGGLLQLQDDADLPSPTGAVKTGIDLGTLQEIVSECGGHLWMTVEPAGDRVVKIRLPLMTSYGEPQSRPSSGGDRMRSLGEWLQHRKSSSTLSLRA